MPYWVKYLGALVGLFLTMYMIYSSLNFDSSSSTMVKNSMEQSAVASEGTSQAIQDLITQGLITGVDNSNPKSIIIKTTPAWAQLSQTEKNITTASLMAHYAREAKGSVTIAFQDPAGATTESLSPAQALIQSAPKREALPFEP